MSRFDLPFRQVHLDFHTSPDIEGIGEKFNPQEFASTLDKARVNSISCFARCHHGMMYYDSKLFPERVHPNLKNRNLLKDQIEACHKRGIRAPIYITVQWDYYTAKEHPEWMAVTEDGAVSGQKPYEPGFYGILCVNTAYRDFLKTHTKEVLESLPVDGLFFDIVKVTDCSCKNCRAGMDDRGMNPFKREDRMKYAQEMINEFKMDMTNFVRQYNKECSIFYNKGHIGTAHRPVVDAYSHFELESLPSGGWGYLHFPLTMRYARNLGIDCLAQTGKFHTSWGDFHSFKNKEALEFECFNMLSLNAKCMIGDQLEPNGKLSEPVYDLIGSVYTQIELREPWCKDAKAVNDIGVFASEEFYGEVIRVRPEMAGVISMLQESANQFDIIDSFSDFSAYKVLILPDTIPVSEEFALKLEKYIEGGGKIIASFESGLNAEKTGFNLKALGVRMKQDQTLTLEGKPARGEVYARADYADYLLPKGEIAKGLPETEHVMYIKGLEVEALEGSEVLADAILPYFNRTYKNFCSHRQAPSSGKVGYQGIVRNGSVIYFAHPIFTQYNQNAPRWCKQLFLNALSMLMPEPILVHDGPTTMMATVNEQADEKRWVVHLLHYISQRRCKDIDVIEDVIPLYNVKVSVKVPGKVKDVALVPEQLPIDFAVADERVKFIVPKIQGHQMIAINIEE